MKLPSCFLEGTDGAKGDIRGGDGEVSRKHIAYRAFTTPNCTSQNLLAWSVIIIYFIKSTSMRHLYLALLISLIFLPGCNIPKVNIASTETEIITCTDLDDIDQVIPIATSIVNAHNNDKIWNLSTPVDTSRFFSIEDYFIDTKNKGRLVWLGFEAGISAGSANNLLMLFNCADTPVCIWSAQVGLINKDDIKDLNNDGIKEIVCTSRMMWMGECNESYTIFNFKGGQHNILFTANSQSFIDCGNENYNERYKKGDTLENKRDCLLMSPGQDKHCQVKQTHTLKIHNGGKTDIGVLNQVKTIIDTAYIEVY